MEELLEEFIDWARENSPDAWWIFENPDEAIQKFIEQREEYESFLGDAGS
ncbi:MAG: hypothetical protein RLY43_50 [Bacteroidota bacterium]|jgi:hypothetical protein